MIELCFFVLFLHGKELLGVGFALNFLRFFIRGMANGSLEMDALEEQDADGSDQEKGQSGNDGYDRSATRDNPFFVLANLVVGTRVTATIFREALRLGNKTNWAAPSSGNTGRW